MLVTLSNLEKRHLSCVSSHSWTLHREPHLQLSTAPTPPPPAMGHELAIEDVAAWSHTLQLSSQCQPVGQSEPNHSVQNTHNCSSAFLSETYFSQLPSNGLSCYHFLSMKEGADNLLIFYLSVLGTGERWKALEVLAYSQNLSSYPSTHLSIHPPTHSPSHPSIHLSSHPRIHLTSSHPSFHSISVH